jgi:hypothetical protein
VDPVNYVVQKAWKALYFAMRFIKKINRYIKCLDYMLSVRPILENGAACWDPWTEAAINALERVKTKSGQFTNHAKNSDWKNVAQRRKIARLCALF